MLARAAASAVGRSGARRRRWPQPRFDWDSIGARDALFCDRVAEPQVRVFGLAKLNILLSKLADGYAVGNIDVRALPAYLAANYCLYGFRAQERVYTEGMRLPAPLVVYASFFEAARSAKAAIVVTLDPPSIDPAGYAALSAVALAAPGEWAWRALAAAPGHIVASSFRPGAGLHTMAAIQAELYLTEARVATSPTGAYALPTSNPIAASRGLPLREGAFAFVLMAADGTFVAHGPNDIQDKDPRLGTIARPLRANGKGQVFEVRDGFADMIVADDALAPIERALGHKLHHGTPVFASSLAHEHSLLPLDQTYPATSCSGRFRVSFGAGVEDPAGAPLLIGTVLQRETHNERHGLVRIRVKLN